MSPSAELVPALPEIKTRIFTVRGQKVIVSIHLAELYGVPHKALMQAVRRNLKRFPDDFLFPLSPQEFGLLKSQFVTSNEGAGPPLLRFQFVTSNSRLPRACRAPSR